LWQQYHYNICYKYKIGTHSYPSSYPVNDDRFQDTSPFLIHTNTIEQVWSNVRRWLHSAHGWPSDYLPLILSEFMYRSRNIDLLTAIEY
jgi:hypothetical protein